MLAIILGVFMAVLDTSIVNVAIPKMMAVFGVGQNDIEWIVTAYSLVSGALIPITGYLGDRFGYKRMYVIALAIFTLGSALCGAAWSNGSMIIFRIIQAIGGGALMPISMSMLFRMFPPERRGMAMGLFGIAVMVAPATGPTLSGYIVEYTSWRWIFTLNVPIGIVDIFLSLAVLKEFKLESARNQTFDFWGFVTSTLGLASLLYGIGKVSEKGWTDSEVLTFIGIGAVLLMIFVAISLTVEQPMLDLRLLKNFTFSLTLILSSLATIIMFGMLFLLPIFLQNINGLSAIDTGLVLLPQAIVSGIMMPIAGALFDKFGARALAVIGLIITAYAFYLTSFLDVSTSNGTIIWWMIIRAVGMGLMMMPIQTAGMNTIPMHKIGQGSALSSTLRQVSSSFGIAWMSLLFTQRKDFHVASLAEQMNVFSAPVADRFNWLQSMYQALGQSVTQARTSALTYLAGQIQIKATVIGMDDVFYVMTGLSVLSAALALLIKDKKPEAGAARHVMGE